MDNEQRITESIISAIKNGSANYIMPWHKAEVPINGINKIPYQGINALSLWASSIDAGFSSSEWATYKAWQSVGRQVRKGQESTKITFFSFMKENDDEGSNEESVKNRRGFRRFYSVFNSEQLEELDETNETPSLTNDSLDTSASRQIFDVANQVKAEVLIGGERAFYSPSRDCVTMPGMVKFFDTRYSDRDVGFASVLAHELIHWTGHESRLDREMSIDKTSPVYAFEELVAELGSAFVCSELKFQYNGVDGHAGYIEGWLDLLENDKKAIFRASSEAMKGKRFLLPEVISEESIPV